VQKRWLALYQHFAPTQLINQSGSSGTGGGTGSASFGLSDLMNVFLFRPDINLAVTIKALQEKNLLQILAEPNLLTASGKEASFLAGGEFPYPVPQSSGGSDYRRLPSSSRSLGYG
jgi:pilus assembly protein CpaC